MSSTEAEARLAELFDGALSEVASSWRARGVQPFPPGANPEAASYYIPRTRGEVYVRAIDASQLADELRRAWAEHPELAALAAELASVAEMLGPGESGEGDVSPLVYAMF
jgi:hypothetical protein